ncbi:hypothetical protein MKEN_01362000 [Mycena kentingensis (nom. inval.)]|nr:hypothetical protein MKEN_01362000 [Mycena kentingensis (nom. inval.)]
MWTRLHEALDALEYRTSPVLSARDHTTVHLPGDFAVSHCLVDPNSTKINLIFQEYLLGQGIALTGQELAIRSSVLRHTSFSIQFTLRRPCVVLGHYSTDELVVCYAVSANSEDPSSFSPYIKYLSIPMDNSAIRTTPAADFGTFLFAVPVVRKACDFIAYRTPKAVRDEYPAVRFQLAYGELEKLRAAVRRNTKWLRKNLDFVRDDFQRWYHDLERPEYLARRQSKNGGAMKPPKVQTMLTVLPEAGKRQNFSLMRFEHRRLRDIRPPRNFAPMDNRIQMLVAERAEYLANASRFLSAALPPQREVFRLPPPLYRTAIRRLT